MGLCKYIPDAGHAPGRSAQWIQIEDAVALQERAYELGKATVLQEERNET